MSNTFVSIAAPFMGWCILAAVLFVLAFPLLVGLLMAFGFIRYREWLAILAVAASMAILAGSGDYIYNLINWTSSRLSPGMNIISCLLVFGTPPFLFILTLTHTRRRGLWGLGILLMTSLSFIAMRSEFVERERRDAEVYRLGMKPLSPRTGTIFVPWWRDYRDQHHLQRIFLLGHIPEGTPIVLLTSPFSRPFRPQFCTGTASAYWPPVKEPRDLGNVTEVAGLKGCSQNWVQGVAFLEHGITNYRAIPFQLYPGELEQQVFENSVVRRAFEKLHYDSANFDRSKAELSRAIGVRQTVLLITALKPIRTPPNAFPCADPSLLVSVHDLENVQIVLPYCALNWNLFQLDDDLYFAATTQQPTPPGEEIMNPEQTSWLFRVEGTDLKQLWPAS
jgi:hypothetical protein